MAQFMCCDNPSVTFVREVISRRTPSLAVVMSCTSSLLTTKIDGLSKTSSGPTNHIGRCIGKLVCKPAKS